MMDKDLGSCQLGQAARSKAEMSSSVVTLTPASNCQENKISKLLAQVVIVQSQDIRKKRH
jgi:hypothetical protein